MGLQIEAVLLRDLLADPPDFFDGVLLFHFDAPRFT